MPQASHVTLSSDALSATVFLPPAELAYYNSSRFDWSSMVGDVQFGGHEFFGGGLWRQPHDARNPECGLGLASEFGCGADGSVCAGGWQHARDRSDNNTYPIANGVLGHDEAEIGGAFLKIGVGVLRRSRCDVCSDGDWLYHFNSRYDFAEPPEWTVSRHARDSVTLSHEARVGSYGYALERNWAVNGARLTSTTTLTNLGQAMFRTPHYSHNLLTIDGALVGDEYALELPLKSINYTEPGVDAGWATPLAAVARATTEDGAVAVDVVSAVGRDDKIKASFPRDDQAPAAFVATHRGPDGETAWVANARSPRRPLYAYDLYVEAATLSPEPVSLLDLEPGASATWTETWAFGQGAPPAAGLLEPAGGGGKDVIPVAVAVLLALGLLLRCGRRSRAGLADEGPHLAA